MKRIISSFTVTMTTAVIITLLTACSASMPQEITLSNKKSPSERTYMPVDFKKWTSGMYADEYFGKDVVVEGYMQKHPGAQYSVRSDITLFIREKSLQQIKLDAQKAAANGNMSADLLRPKQIIVNAPLSMRDQIYPLNDDQKVRIYGVVVNPYSKSIFTRQVVSSSLFVKAEKIEVIHSR